MRQHRTRDTNTVKKKARTESAAERLVLQHIVDDLLSKEIISIDVRGFFKGRWIEIDNGLSNTTSSGCATNCLIVIDNISWGTQMKNMADRGIVKATVQHRTAGQTQHNAIVP